MYRTYTCWEIDSTFVWKKIKLAWWVSSSRDHWWVIFIDLRDRYGITQIVFNPENKQTFQIGEKLKNEYVISIEWNVVKRPDWLQNKNIFSWEIEVIVENVDLISKSNVIPFSLDEFWWNIWEDIRLKYRYLDIRTQRIKDNLIFRSKFIYFIHNWFQKNWFIEVHTPILTSSSPEWARDFLVPSRLNKWTFYALPQAPQQYKQLLMIWWLDKYYQIAPCFRDEDPRADRSPWEFYQLDVETSFLTQDEFHNLMEPFFYELVKNFVPEKQIPWQKFPKIKYNDAMNEYGNDRPDLRFWMKITDITEIFKNTQFSVFKNVFETNNWKIKAIKLEWKILTRKEIDDLTEFAKLNWAKWLAYIIYENWEAKSPILKYFSEQEKQDLIKKLDIKWNEVIFFAADESLKASKLLWAVRLKLRDMLNLANKNLLAFAWIVDFPMFERSDDEKRWDFAHNPFSMPQWWLDALNSKKPEDIEAYQYDIICNWLELSSWAVRNQDPEILIKAFWICWYKDDLIKKKFWALYEAFQYWAPPHCWFAPWIDRMIMLLRDEPNIREVIAFPKNWKAQDLMMWAPWEVDPKQLKDLWIQIKL